MAPGHVGESGLLDCGCRWCVLVSDSRTVCVRPNVRRGQPVSAQGGKGKGKKRKESHIWGCMVGRPEEWGVQ